MADEERDGQRDAGSSDVSRGDDGAPREGGAVEGAAKSERPAGPDDATAALPREPKRPEPDETRPQPPVDETRVQPPLDETRPQPAVEGTQPIPAPTSWSGRAEVPPPRPVGPAPGQWEAPSPDEGRRWWLPIVVGLVALLLLGVLGYGLWLIAESEDATPSDRPTPAPTAPVTTAPPTTEQPTATEEPTEPAEVQVPPLAGEPLDAATAELDDLGLRYRVRYEVTDEQAPGTVIYTEPEAGTAVSAGDRITLHVAAPPEPTEEPTPTGTSEPGGDGGEG